MRWSVSRVSGQQVKSRGRRRCAINDEGMFSGFKISPTNCSVFAGFVSIRSAGSWLGRVQHEITYHVHR